MCLEDDQAWEIRCKSVLSLSRRHTALELIGSERGRPSTTVRRTQTCLSVSARRISTGRCIDRSILLPDSLPTRCMEQGEGQVHSKSHAGM